MRSVRVSRRRALSLVEVLIALAIASAMLLPFTALLQLGGKSARSGQRRAAALLFAHEALEILRAEMDTWTADAMGSLALPRFELTAPRGYSYRIEVQGRAQDLDEVGVVVEWSEEGRPRYVRLACLISRRGSLAGPGGRP